jgi:hypothetical protein
MLFLLFQRNFTVLLKRYWLNQKKGTTMVSVIDQTKESLHIIVPVTHFSNEVHNI